MPAGCPAVTTASIATEAKVVQMLEERKRHQKSELSREDFRKWPTVEEKYGNIIYHQRAGGNWAVA